MRALCNTTGVPLPRASSDTGRGDDCGCGDPGCDYYGILQFEDQSEVISAATKPLRNSGIEDPDFPHRCLAWNGNVHDLSIPTVPSEVIDDIQQAEEEMVIDDPEFVESNYEKELNHDVDLRKANNEFTRSWLASADDGSQSDTIKPEDPIGEQTLPKLLLQTELS